MSKSLGELDMLVAENVMGWIEKRNEYGSLGFHNVDDGESVDDSPWPKEWQPTRRIEQAWEVLEKLGFPFRLFGQWPNGPKYDCAIAGGDGVDYTAEGKAETAPLAICMAALRAKGIALDGETK